MGDINDIHRKPKQVGKSWFKVSAIRVKDAKVVGKEGTEAHMTNGAHFMFILQEVSENDAEQDLDQADWDKIAQHPGQAMFARIDSFPTDLETLPSSDTPLTVPAPAGLGGD